MQENISKIDFTVTIHESEVRKQNFGQVTNAFIRICNEETGEGAKNGSLKNFLQKCRKFFIYSFICKNSLYPCSDIYLSWHYRCGEGREF